MGKVRNRNKRNGKVSSGRRITKYYKAKIDNTNHVGPNEAASITTHYNYITSQGASIVKKKAPFYPPLPHAEACRKTMSEKYHIHYTRLHGISR